MEIDESNVEIEASASIEDDEEEEDLEVESVGDYEVEDFDEPDAEGEANVSSFVEPSYDLANKIEFCRVAGSLEYISKKTKTMAKSKQRPNFQEMLEKLLSTKVLEVFRRKGEDGRPQSLYPWLRLLMGDKDNARQFRIKHKMLAKMYITGLGLGKDHEIAMALLNFTDPDHNHHAPGDFLTTLYECLKNKVSDDGADCKSPETGESKRMTVGEMNEALDELASIGRKPKKSLHMNVDSSNNVVVEGQNPAPDQALQPEKQRGEWLSSLIKNQRLTRVEHKWLAAIILGELKISIGDKRIMKYIHPSFSNLYDSHNSLKAVCDMACQDFALNEVEQTETNDRPTASYLSVGVDVDFGSPFTPMCSKKTGFEQLLNDISKRHREQARESNGMYAESPILLHPTFCIETKLDGERMIVHYRRDGVVKIHSRRAVFYSDYYAPSLGPAIRRAVGKHQCDLILDGEILAWDNFRKETIPFGNNRTIANLRRRWLEKNEGIDPRDLDIHIDDTGIKTQNPTGDSFAVDISNIEESAGEECWLQFQIFDILYIEGEKASDILESALSPHIERPCETGSIVGLDLMERKKILYRMIETQENEVEIVDTLVVRSNGEKARGEDYFLSDELTSTDSISRLFHLRSEHVEELDSKVRETRNDEEMSLARALRVDFHYKHIVEHQRLEGLLFKDLSTPYYLGEISRGFGYWLKFKPDYFNGSVASDLDLLVVGAYFASGLRLSGRPSSLLCACVDHHGSATQPKYLSVCKVSASSLQAEDYEKLMSITKFSAPRANAPIQYGEWFRLNYPEVPSFISPRSLQDGQMDKGWRASRNEYPDMWINPEDSVVVTLNAGEITSSELFSCGLTLRFPRITKLRVDGDSKDPSEIESDASLWDIYEKYTADRTKNAVSQPLSPGLRPACVTHLPCRFLTEDQTKKKRGAKKKARRAVRGVKVSTEEVESKSRALEGVSFTVLSGRYFYHEKTSGPSLGKAWMKEASRVKSKHDVEAFLRSHGATIFVDGGEMILGGRGNDPKVITTASSRTVVRWLFVYELVYDWIQEGKGATPMVDTEKDRLDPGLLHTFASSDTVNKSLRNMGRIDSPAEMYQALEIAHRANLFESRSNTWDEIVVQFDEDNRWIVDTGIEVLWPWTKTNSDRPGYATVIYVDSEMLDTESEISLSFARLMGAKVKEEFDSSTTHVLTLLKDEELSMGCTIEALLNGDDLGIHFECLERLKELFRSKREAMHLDTRLCLITSRWINSHWNKN